MNDSNFFLNRTFSNLDEFMTMVQHWDLDFWQLKRGHLQGKIFQVITPSWHLSQAQFNRAIKQQGLPPRHLRNIVIPAISSQQFKWRDHNITGNDVMIFPLGGELECISDERFHIFILGIPEVQLSAICESLNLLDMSNLTQGVEVIRCEPTAMESLRYQLNNIYQQITLNPTLVGQPNFSHIIEYELVEKILLTITQGHFAARTPLLPRQGYVLKKATNYIHDNCEQLFNVRDLCKQLNISERTLRTAFRNHYGISPKTYINHLRLNQVRRQLRQADPEYTKVSDIANIFNFWHMGQFAKDYKIMFGEYPSATLKLR